MPNATVRATATDLPKSTSRRAVMGAALAAGALGATAALPAYAAPGPVALSAIDRRVLDLWNRREGMRAALQRISHQIDIARAQMPELARGGPKYLLAPEGSPYVSGIDLSDLGGHSVGWPQVADLDRRLAGASGWVLARPNVEDLYEQFKTACRSGNREDATRDFLQALLAHDARVKEQDAEEDRVGYKRLNALSEAGWGKVQDIEEAIRKHMGTSVLAVAASLVINIQFDDDEKEVLQAYRASLRAIRPQLVGAIAADADRVLAERSEVAA